MVRKLLAAAAGAATARAVLRELRGLPALDRTNFRGRTVSLAGGPALAAGAAAGAFLGAAGRSAKADAARPSRADAARDRRAAHGAGAATRADGAGHHDGAELGWAGRLVAGTAGEAGHGAAGHGAAGHGGARVGVGRHGAASGGAAGRGAAGRAVDGRGVAGRGVAGVGAAGRGAARVGGDRHGAAGGGAAGRGAAGHAVAGHAAAGHAAAGRAAAGRGAAGRAVRGVDRSGRGPRVMGAVAVAGLGAGAVGLYDDLVGGRPEHAAKGFRGHLGALKEGRVTSGLVKIAGVGAAGLVAAAMLPGRRKVDVLLGAGVIAGAANLFNLLDLRPGRAIKAGIIVGTPLAAGRGGGAAAGALGAAGALLAADLGEEIMLGDAGANALGAVLGTAYVARTGTFGRLAALAGLVALTAASEKVSFTQVIEKTPALRAIDRLGRLRPISPPAMAAPPAAQDAAQEAAQDAAQEAAQEAVEEPRPGPATGAAELQAAADGGHKAADGGHKAADGGHEAAAQHKPKPSPRPRRDG